MPRSMHKLNFGWHFSVPHQMSPLYGRTDNWRPGKFDRHWVMGQTDQRCCQSFREQELRICDLLLYSRMQTNKFTEIDLFQMWCLRNYLLFLVPEKSALGIDLRIGETWKWYFVQEVYVRERGKNLSKQNL